MSSRRAGQPRLSHSETDMICLPCLLASLVAELSARPENLRREERKALGLLWFCPDFALLVFSIFMFSFIFRRADVTFLLVSFLPRLAAGRYPAGAGAAWSAGISVGS